MCSNRYIEALFATLLLISLAGHARAQEVPGCGNLSNAYGPFDYTDPNAVRDKLPIVETNHFTVDVETLTRGDTGPIWGDLDYTLRAFPNHHRALYAAARYALTPEGRNVQPGALSAECYFQRALAFQPDDAVTHMIYGIFLHRQDKLPDAQEQYQEAVRLMPILAEAHYNLGLLYADMDDYERAQTHAEEAYRLGYPLQGLKMKLRNAGVED